MKLWVVILLLLIGMGPGVRGTIWTPQLARQYAPEFLRAKREVVEGDVERKVREQDRVLLTVQTPHGTILAIFKKRVGEIDLLVQKGDRLTLVLRRYEPFVEDPVIERVKRPEPGPRPAGGEPSPSGGAGGVSQEKPSQ